MSFDYISSENKELIYTKGHHVPGCEYTEVWISKQDNQWFYTVMITYDKMNSGGYSYPVPERFLLNGKVETQGLLNYLNYR